MQRKTSRWRCFALKTSPIPPPAEAIQDLVLAIEHGAGPESERIGHGDLRITPLRLSRTLRGMQRPLKNLLRHVLRSAGLDVRRYRGQPPHSLEALLALYDVDTV